MQTNDIWSTERLDMLARKHIRLARRMGLSPEQPAVKLGIATVVAVNALKGVSEAYEQLSWARWQHYWAQYLPPADGSAREGSA